MERCTMEAELTFTTREMNRYGAIQALMDKKMTTMEAAMCLGIPTRQIQLIKKKRFIRLKRTWFHEWP